MDPTLIEKGTMMLKRIDPTRTQVWDELNRHCERLKDTHMKDLPAIYRIPEHGVLGLLFYIHS